MNREQLLELIHRNYQWFTAHDLPSPLLYVPPAWALGDISTSQLHDNGFHYPVIMIFFQCPGLLVFPLFLAALS